MVVIALSRYRRHISPDPAGRGVANRRRKVRKLTDRAAVHKTLVPGTDIQPLNGVCEGAGVEAAEYI
jgi:hypothetical protein